MIGSTAVVVDSASYLPGAVREHFGMTVVPMTVVVDGKEYREFETLGAAQFYTMLAAGAQVSTSQPPPGLFVDAYEAASRAGAGQVLSIHIGSAISGTVNSARTAANLVDVPVTVVDTGQASFIEGLAAWEACEVLAGGGTVEEAETAAIAAGKSAGNVFLVRGMELLRAGGRVRPEAEVPAGVPILAADGAGIHPVASATTVEEALALIVERATTAMEGTPGKRFRVGVANGDAGTLAAELMERMRTLPMVDEVVEYVIGPAVGAHTGPGCTGVVFLGRPVS
jgi:DegV family protein with EDD domain